MEERTFLQQRTSQREAIVSSDVQQTGQVTPHTSAVTLDVFERDNSQTVQMWTGVRDHLQYVMQQRQDAVEVIQPIFLQVCSYLQQLDREHVATMETYSSSYYSSVHSDNASLQWIHSVEDQLKVISETNPGLQVELEKLQEMLQSCTQTVQIGANTAVCDSDNRDCGHLSSPQGVPLHTAGQGEMRQVLSQVYEHIQKAMVDQPQLSDSMSSSVKLLEAHIWQPEAPVHRNTDSDSQSPQVVTGDTFVMTYKNEDEPPKKLRKTENTELQLQLSNYKAAVQQLQVTQMKTVSVIKEELKASFAEKLNTEELEMAFHNVESKLYKPVSVIEERNSSSDSPVENVPSLPSICDTQNVSAQPPCQMPSTLAPAFKTRSEEITEVQILKAMLEGAQSEIGKLQQQLNDRESENYSLASSNDAAQSDAMSDGPTLEGADDQILSEEVDGDSSSDSDADSVVEVTIDSNKLKTQNQTQVANAEVDALRMEVTKLKEELATERALADQVGSHPPNMTLETTDYHESVTIENNFVQLQGVTEQTAELSEENVYLKEELQKSMSKIAELNTALARQSEANGSVAADNLVVAENVSMGTTVPLQSTSQENQEPSESVSAGTTLAEFATTIEDTPDSGTDPVEITKLEVERLNSLLCQSQSHVTELQLRLNVLESDPSVQQFKETSEKQVKHVGTQNESFTDTTKSDSQAVVVVDDEVKDDLENVSQTQEQQVHSSETSHLATMPVIQEPCMEEPAVRSFTTGDGLHEAETKGTDRVVSDESDRILEMKDAEITSLRIQLEQMKSELTQKSIDNTAGRVSIQQDRESERVEADLQGTEMNNADLEIKVQELETVVRGQAEELSVLKSRYQSTQASPAVEEDTGRVSNMGVNTDVPQQTSDRLTEKINELQACVKMQENEIFELKSTREQETNLTDLIPEGKDDPECLQEKVHILKKKKVPTATLR